MLSQSSEFIVKMNKKRSELDSAISVLNGWKWNFIGYTLDHQANELLEKLEVVNKLAHEFAQLVADASFIEEQIKKQKAKEAEEEKEADAYMGYYGFR